MGNIIQLAWLVPLFPFIGFLINGLGRRSLSKSAIGVIGSGSVLLSFVLSIMIFMQVLSPGFTASHGLVRLFDFISYDKVHIPFSFQIDQLSALFLLIITGVGFLIHVYSTSYMHDEEPEHFARFFSYLNLFVFSMLLLVMGSNFVIMFLGWEGVGLCSYLLIGFWFKTPEYNKAANKAFIMNRIGDVGFLLAVFYILTKLGTVEYQEVFAAAGGFSTKDVTIITLLLLLGATGKSAQIPLYTWLPDAMAGPTPVSALIHAATMVTAGIYMIARCNILYTMAPATQTVVAIIGLATAILAATIALKQNDIKKVLAYSTVSQLGYMFIGLGVGAYTGAVFHVMTHAFFKALLFLGAGSVIHAMGGEQDMRNMGGLRKKMPVTHVTFLLACLAIAGVPPLSGFFSKDEILAGAYLNNPVYFYIGSFGALLTAFYMFRLYGMTFLGNFRGTHEQEHHLHESPPAITFPLVVLAILSVFAGFLGLPEVFVKNGHALQNFLAPIFAQSAELKKAGHLDHTTEILLMAVVAVLVIAIIIYAWNRFSKYQREEEGAKGFGRVLENKWYVDELYDAVVVKPLHVFAGFLNKGIERVIDGLVNGIGRTVQYSSRQLRLVQSGQVGSYILLMIVSTLAFFVIVFFLKK